MVSFTDHYNAISIDRLGSKTKVGKNSWKRFRKINVFYVSPSSSQLQRLCVSKKKIAFSIKTQKPSSAIGWWENTKSSFKEDAKSFFKSSTTQENFEKENFEPKTKPMIENLQNELYQLENKQAKYANNMLNMLTLDRRWRARKAPKLS